MVTQPFWRQGDIYFVKLDEEINSVDATPVKIGIIAKGVCARDSARSVVGLLGALFRKAIWCTLGAQESANGVFLCN